VFHQSPRGESIGAAADLARAIDWLMAQKTPVINMSLAGPPNAILEAAVRRAQDRGHIVVAAVGNAGPAARPQYPAAYAGVVGVTAIDDNGRVYRRAVRGQHVDFAAPGVAVAAASPAGPDSAVSGTSFAAPYVAAALALRHTALDPLSAQRAVADLARESADLGDPGQDPVYGFGAVPLRAMTR
jgi:subtilisin family serine protease